MKPLAIAALAAAAAAAPLSAARADAPAPDAAAKADAEDSPAAKLARVRRLVDRYGPSTVRVFYRFKLDDDGEKPEFSVRYTCPNCGGSHERDADEYLGRNTAFEAVGFLLAPDRVLMQDLRVLPKWVASIEVEAAGRRYPARELTRYPAEGGLLLATDAPVADAKPLAFAGRGLPEKPAWFYLVSDDGLLVSGVKGPSAAAFKHYAESGKDVCEGAANTILVDAEDNAVTVALQDKVLLGEETVAPPSEWKGVPAAAFAEALAGVEKRVAAGVVPLYLRFESRPKETARSRYDRDSVSDEGDGLGFALPGGEVLLPINLSAEDAARLDVVEYQAPGGARTRLEFVGAFDEWGAFLMRFPEGRLPDGVSPVAFDTRGPAGQFLSTAYVVKAANNDGKPKFTVREVRVEGFRQQWGGSFAPALPADSDDALVFPVDPDGRVMALALKRRQNTDRWHDRESNRTGAELAAMLAARTFNPEFAPRADTDRNRVAWIGAEALRLTAEVAREKKATAFIGRNGEGALVTRVYPGTPAAAAGIKEGDVLLSVRPAAAQNVMPLSVEGDYGGGFSFAFYESDNLPEFLLAGRGATPWPNAEGGVNGRLSRLGIGAQVVVAWSSDGVRKEAAMTLEQLPVHYANARRSRNRDIGMTVCDMTFEVRGYFRLKDDEPGVVVAKLKSGDPAAVAGLRPYEIITEVNGKKVFSARDFAAAVKGAKELTFAVRRLTATRIVRIALNRAPGGAQPAAGK